MRSLISEYANTTVSNELAIFTSTRTKLLEGDTLSSDPPGFFLKHYHGQLVVCQGEPETTSSTILWQTHPYKADESSIRSYVDFQADCNLIIYSETELKRNRQDAFHSILWESGVPNLEPNNRWDYDNCFLAWSMSEKKLAIINNGTEYSAKSSDAFYIDGWKSRSNNRLSSPADKGLVLLLSTENVLPGFLVESEPHGLYTQLLDGVLYVYRGTPNDKSATLIWKTDDPYIFDGDSELTWSALQHDCNFIVYAPFHQEECCPQFLWKTGTETKDVDDCFLAWVPSEERLALYEGVIDQPGREIWTSQNFHWEPMHPDISAKSQTIVMILTRTSATLSIFGSGLILGIILARWKKNKKIFSTRDRLIFCMSFLDFFASFAHSLDVTPIPRGTYGIEGARGTQGTCTAQGFFIQLGFAVPLYNCLLCLHALLIVRFKLKDGFIVSRIEPCMHLAGFGYALATSLSGIFLQLYNSNGSFCWVEGYPHDCNSISGIKCLRGENAYVFQWLFAGVMVMLSFAVIALSMGGLYFFIRRNVTLMTNRWSASSNSASALHLNEVGKQAFLYVIAFLITFIWPMSVAIERHYGLTPPIWQNALLSLFFPLQGFWNFLIFIRPMYNRIKRQNPLRSCIWILRAAIAREATVSYGTRVGVGGRRGDDNIRLINAGLSHRQRQFLVSSRNWSSPFRRHPPFNASPQNNNTLYARIPKPSKVDEVLNEENDNYEENMVCELAHDDADESQEKRPLSQLLRGESEEVIVSAISSCSDEIYPTILVDSITPTEGLNEINSEDLYEHINVNGMQSSDEAYEVELKRLCEGKTITF